MNLISQECQVGTATKERLDPKALRSGADEPQVKGRAEGEQEQKSSGSPSLPELDEPIESGSFSAE